MRHGWSAGCAPVLPGWSCHCHVGLWSHGVETTQRLGAPWGVSGGFLKSMCHLLKEGRGEGKEILIPCHTEVSGGCLGCSSASRSCLCVVNPNYSAVVTTARAVCLARFAPLWTSWAQLLLTTSPLQAPECAHRCTWTCMLVKRPVGSSPAGICCCIAATAQCSVSFYRQLSAFGPIIAFLLR